MSHDRAASQLHDAFVSHGLELERSAWLLFLHELSDAAWGEVGPPVGSDWRSLAGCPDDVLGERLDRAVGELRRRWADQIADALQPVNYAAVPAHVLREAMKRTEKLSASTLHHSGAPFAGRGELFGRLYMTRRGYSAKRARGEFYTPLPVAQLLAQISGPGPGEWVLDPACGTGHLFLGLLWHFRRQHGHELSRTLTLIGVEISPAAAELCRMQLLLAGCDPDQFQILCGDALASPICARDDEDQLRPLKFHATLANPPFGTAIAPPTEAGEPLVVDDRVARRTLRVPPPLRAKLLECGLARQPA